MFARAYNGIDAAVLPKHHVILVTEGTTSRGDFENRRTEWVADQRV